MDKSSGGLLGSRLKFLLTDTIIYGVANAISKLALLIALPIMTRYFTISDYGKIDAITFFANLLLVFFVFGQDSSLIRFYYEFEKLEDKKKVISNSFIIQLTIAILFTPILIFFSRDISIFYLEERDYRWVVVLVVLQLPFSLLISLASNVLRIESRKYSFLAINLGSTISYILAIVIGIVYFKISIGDVFILFFISKIIFGVLAFLMIKNWLAFKLDKKILKDLVKFGVPFAVICLIGASLPNLDRYFIIKYLDNAFLGMYAVGYKVAMILQLPIYAFEVAWVPFYMSMYRDEDSPKTYQLISKVYSAFLLTCVTGLALSDNLLVSLIASSKYEKSSMVLIPIGFGLIVKSIGGILGIGVELSKKSYLKVISYTSGLVTSILVTIFLIEEYRTFGVALGFLAGYCVNVTISTYLALRNYNLTFDIGRIAISFFLTFSFLMASKIFEFETLLSKLTVLVLNMLTIYLLLLQGEIKKILYRE